MKLRPLFICIAFAVISISASAQRSAKEIAVSRVKALFVATAKGDVAKLKSLVTPEFYAENFPYSDAQVREILLSAPYEKRMQMIDQIQNHSDAETIMNRAGDCITVTLINRVTKKEFTVQLTDVDGNGDWRVFSSWQ